RGAPDPRAGGADRGHPAPAPGVVGLLPAPPRAAPAGTHPAPDAGLLPALRHAGGRVSAKVRRLPPATAARSAGTNHENKKASLFREAFRGDPGPGGAPDPLKGRQPTG